MAEAFGRNLVRRVITAAVVLPVAIGAIALFPPHGAYFIAAMFLILGFTEAHELLRRSSPGLSHFAFFPGLGLFFVLGGLPSARIAVPDGIIFLFVIVAAWAAVRRAEAEGSQVLPSEAGAVLAGLLVGAGAGSAAGLATMTPVQEGVGRVFLLIAIVVASDVAAFFVGHAIGRTKLAPNISPGKTVEGAIGGLLGAAGAAALVSTYFIPASPPALMAALGLLVGAAGIVGDLLESLFKRYVGVKDSGSVFPGHGGVLDRLDAFLLASPLLYGFFRSLS